MKYNNSKYVVCPYFLAFEDKKIHCEGTERNTTLHLCFKGTNKRYNYSKKFCENIDNFENCWIADMLSYKHTYNDKKIGD